MQAQEPQGFDVNDVSVLFPLDQQLRPAPLLALAGHQPQFSLLTPAIFSAVMQRAAELGVKAAPGVLQSELKHWYVVGFRYDPCAPHDFETPEGQCVRELRLVAQPMEEGIGPADSALHIIYKFGVNEPTKYDPVLWALLRLKRSAERLVGDTTAAKPLGRHPLLEWAVRQKRPDVLRLFSDFLRAHARAELISKVTMMGLGDGSATEWVFFAGNVKAGTWTSARIPNLAAHGNKSMRFNVLAGADSFSPRPVDGGLSTDLFFNSPAPSVERSVDFLSRVSHTIENPRLSDRNTVDCVSCHTATTMRLSPDYPFLAHMPNVSFQVPHQISAYPAPAVLQHHPLQWNLRAFGYFGSDPAISMRTVAESGMAAEIMNDILGLMPPGLDCSLVEQEVTHCLLASSVPFAESVTAQECLSRCERR